MLESDINEATKPAAAEDNLDPYPHLAGTEGEPLYLRVVESDFREVGPLDSVAELYLALARAQSKFTPIAKNRTAKINSPKGNYTFDFADLEGVLTATRPHLNAEHIAVLQPPAQVKPGVLVLRTILARGSARLECVTKFAYEGDIKAMGAAITYHRRYQYNGLVAVAADADADDGPSESELSGTSGPRQPAKPPQRPEPPQPTHRPSERPPSARAPHEAPQRVVTREITEEQKTELSAQFRRLRWSAAMMNTECLRLTGVTTSALNQESAEALLVHMRAQRPGPT